VSGDKARKGEVRRGLAACGRRGVSERRTPSAADRRADQHGHEGHLVADAVRGRGLRAHTRWPLVAHGDRGLLLFDRSTGTLIRRIRLYGLIWARISGGRRDRLATLDPGTGRVVTSIGLDDFGGSGVAAIDGELWLTTVGGAVEIYRP
jgi:hypothetical protein